MNLGVVLSLVSWWYGRVTNRCLFRWRVENERSTRRVAPTVENNNNNKQQQQQQTTTTNNNNKQQQTTTTTNKVSNNEQWCGGGKMSPQLR
jgi:hypothetical protein